MKDYQKGFTLVEIAIVMVIIGLLLGGALKGQKMIENAKGKRLAADIEQFRAALYSFQDIYRELPGDMASGKATKFFGPDMPAVGGNGKDGIGGGWCEGADEESCKAWQHLRMAGLISGDPKASGADARPSHPFGGYYDSLSTGNWSDGITSIKLLIRSMPSDLAARLDTAYDDGNGKTGKYLCANGSNGVKGACDWSAPGAQQHLFIAM